MPLYPATFIVRSQCHALSLFVSAHPGRRDTDASAHPLHGSPLTYSQRAGKVTTPVAELVRPVWLLNDKKYHPESILKEMQLAKETYKNEAMYNDVWKSHLRFGLNTFSAEVFYGPVVIHKRGGGSGMFSKTTYKKRHAIITANWKDHHPELHYLDLDGTIKGEIDLTLYTLVPSNSKPPKESEKEAFSLKDFGFDLKPKAGSGREYHMVVESERFYELQQIIARIAANPGVLKPGSLIWKPGMFRMTESTIQVSHDKDFLTRSRWDRADNVWDVDVSHTFAI